MNICAHQVGASILPDENSVPGKINLSKSGDFRPAVIERMLEARLAMKPIGYPGFPRREQRMAQPDQIFELRRTGGRYFFAPTVPRPKWGVPAPNGTFVFVILPDNPGLVLCAVHPDDRMQPYRSPFMIDGHTSFRDNRLLPGQSCTPVSCASSMGS
jgi:hypothetical protein